MARTYDRAVGLSLRWVSYGRDAASALAEEIGQAKGGDPLAPVTVVVPTNLVGVVARRTLATGSAGPVASRGAGIAAVTFHTPYRLAERIGGARLAASGRMPASRSIIASSIRAALSKEPGSLAQVSDHPSTETALLAAYMELRRLSGEALERLAATSELSSDVVRIHLAAHEQLEGAFFDEEDLVESAIQELSRGAGLADCKAVIVHLPDRLSPTMAELVRSVAERVEVAVLAGSVGSEEPDTSVKASVERLVGKRPALLPPPKSPMGTVSKGRTSIVTTSDPDEEVRAALRAVVEATRRGTPLWRIAILYPDRNPYEQLVHEQLEAASIAHNGTECQLASSVAGRTLLQLFDLSRSGFGRAEVMAWLAGAPFASVPAQAAADWQRISRLAGVIAGRDHWDRRLAAYAQDCDSRANTSKQAGSRGGDGAPEPRTEGQERRERREAGYRETARVALELRSFVLWLIDDLDEAALYPRGWKDHASWVKEMMCRLLGEEEHLDSWPALEGDAVRRITRALDRLSRLETLEGPVPLELFRNALELELGSEAIRRGRIGEGLLVGTLEKGVGLDLDLVIILGMVEGSLPATARFDPLLPDRDRAAADGELELGAQRAVRQHHDLLASLGGADEHLLCVPRGDLRQTRHRFPSRWVIEAAELLDGTEDPPAVGTSASGSASVAVTPPGTTGASERTGAPERTVQPSEWHAGKDDPLGSRRPFVNHVSSHYGGLQAASFPATETEYRLKALMEDPRPRPGVSVLGAEGPGAALLLGDSVLSSGVDMVRTRRSARFSRFDGNLAGLVVASPTETVTSPTRLEAWAKCPFAYLMSEVLSVEVAEVPEDRVTISPLDLGSLVHEILELFMKDVLARPDDEQPRPGEPWNEKDKALLVGVARSVMEQHEERGLTGRSILWRIQARSLLSDLVAFMDKDSTERGERRSRPLAAELSFGLEDGPLHCVALPITQGRNVAFRGIVDRLDIAEDGSLHVIDYKTGRADDYVSLSEDSPEARGTKLQLPVYALAARLHVERADARVRSEYVFTSSRASFRRIGYWMSDAVLETVGTTVGQIVDGIAAGVFPSYPRATSTTPYVECPYCDPDNLGVSELRRNLDRKREDPALAAFLGLAEPSDEIDSSATLGGRDD